MSLRYIEDVALMQPNIPTNTKGVETVVSYYKNATNELKNLLQNECDVIFECNYCKNLFRSIVNFVTHKRTYCRSLSQSVSALSSLANQVNELVDERTGTRKPSEEKEARSSKVTAKPQLRRVNLNAAVNKHIEKVNVPVPNTNDTIELSTLPRIAKPAPITSFQDGHQWVEEIPSNIAVKERIPEDRVLVLMPQDKSIRYGEMQLRRRKDPNSQEVTREIKLVEATTLEKLPTNVKDLIDLSSFTCLHSDCKEKSKSYPSAMLVIYHLCIQHSQDIQKKGQEEPEAYLCFICQKTVKSVVELQSHLINRHKQIHQNYIHSGGVVESITPARKSTRNRGGKADESTVTAMEESEPEDEEETETEASQEISEKEKAVIASVNKNRRKYQRTITRPQEMLDFNKKAVVEIEKIDNSKIRPHLARELSMEQAEEIDNLLQSFKPNSDAKEKPKSDMEIKQELDEDDVNAIVSQCVSNIKAAVAKENGDLTREQTMSPSPEADEKTPDNVRKGGRKRMRRSVENRSCSNGVKPEKRIESDTKSDSGSSQRNHDQEDEAIEGEDGDDSIIAHRPKRAARRPERFRDDSDYITYDKSKRNSDTADATSEGDMPKTPGKRGKKQETTKKCVEEKAYSDTTTTVTPSPESQEMEKLPEKRLKIDLAKLAKKRITETPKASEPNTRESTPAEKTKLTESARPQSAPQAKKDWVLPVIKKPPVDNAVAQRNLDPKEFHEDLKFYTPRARKVRENDDDKAINSRRKQVLPRESDDLQILKAPGHIPPRPADLSEIPVYLTEVQRDIFFAPLKPLFTGKADGNHQCSECGKVLRSIQEGRRHMVGHIRVVRLRCSLCDVGAFFCSDMRTHLMNRHCPNLHLAPIGYVKDGIPCMTRQQADELSRLVDPKNPGRVMYTSGKIISCDNPTPYRPDPRIEESILGPARPHYLSRSPKKAHIPSSEAPSSSTNIS